MILDAALFLFDLFSFLLGMVVAHAALTWLLYLPVVRIEHYVESRLPRGLAEPSAALPAWFKYGVAPLWGAVDGLFNCSSACLLFWDRPRELLFTHRMRRYLTAPLPGDEDFAELFGRGAATWRYYAAQAVCAALLDPYAPEGRHCRCEK